LLFPFVGHDRISPNQLKKYIANHLLKEDPNAIVEQLLAEGWIQYYPQHPACVGKLQFMNDGYFLLSRKTKDLFE